MMGHWEKQNELWVEPVNLARRIPEDHLLRKINGVLDLSFVRREVAGCYGRNGQVSVDPVIIMKLMLLLFLDNVRSERELMRVLPLRIDWLWFLGYGLEDEVPNHSVLSKARRRWGGEVFERLFARSVEQCMDAGLIDGEKLHVDASLVAANASRNSIVAVVVEKQIAKLEERKEEEAGSGGGPVNREHRSTTDKEATLVRHQSGKSTPSYKNHRAIDDKAGVITAVATTTGAVDEGRHLLDLLDQHGERTGCRASIAVADSRYGNTANFIALAKRNVRAHVADLRSRQNNARAQGIYPPERFAYDKEKDRYRCPAGRKLYRHHFHAGRGYFEYRTRVGVCEGCRLRHLCTRSKSGRTLNRYAGQELLDRARRQSHSAAARRDRQRRQWLQEGNFGQAAVLHGFKRARWRGLIKQSIQDLLIAAIQNLKILARKGMGNGNLPFDDLLALFRPLQCALRSLLKSVSSLLPFPNFFPHLSFGQQPVST